MLKKSKLSLAVAGALGLTSMSFMPAAQAQEQGAGQLEEVVVTGSRIERNPETYQPMSLVGQDQLLRVGLPIPWTH